MSERQISRLDAARTAAFNPVFREHRDTLSHFGYELMDGTHTCERRQAT